MVHPPTSKAVVQFFQCMQAYTPLSLAPSTQHTAKLEVLPFILALSFIGGGILQLAPPITLHIARPQIDYTKTERN